MENKNKYEYGFTLIELLISLSIISVILFVTYSMINNNIKNTTRNQKDINAINIAQTEIENLRYKIKREKNLTIYDDEISTEKPIILDGTTLYKKKDLNNDNIYFDIILTVKRPTNIREEGMYIIKIKVKQENEYLRNPEINIETKIFR